MRRPRWPDPPPEPEGFVREVVTSDSDADLAVYHAPARGGGLAVVCILHDVAEHAARYAPAALALAAQGLHVYAHDHRGHGATRADDAPLGVFAERDGFDRVLADAVHVAERARAAHRRLPVIALGLGLGGVVALNQMLSRPDSLDGVVIWNADIDAGRVVALRRRLARASLFGRDRGGRRVWARLMDAYCRPFRPTRTTYDWLSRDPDAVDRYIADPLCGRPPSVALWRDVATGTERVCVDASFGAIPRGTPFHLLGGSDDPVTDGGASVVALDTRLRDMGFSDVSRVILGGARHDTLNDLCREDALKLLVRWIDRVAAGQPYV